MSKKKAAGKEEASVPSFELDVANAAIAIKAKELNMDQAIDQVLEDWDAPREEIQEALEAEVQKLNEAEASEKAAVEAAEKLEAEKKAAEDKVRQESDKVVVNVPKKFNLRLDHETVTTYHAGMQDMPRAHAEHWYSKANGVKIHGE